MNPKIKNIIIFLVAAIILVFVAIYFIGGKDEEGGLLSSVISDTPTEEGMIDSKTTSNFLALLLSVRNIRLDDSIFSEPAFTSLRDSTVILVPDGNEGRPNPFAPIGSDIIETPPEPASPVVTEPEATPGPTSPTTPTSGTTPKPTSASGATPKPTSSTTPNPQAPSQGNVGSNPEEDLTGLDGELESLLGDLEE